MDDHTWYKLEDRLRELYIIKPESELINNNDNITVSVLDHPELGFELEGFQERFKIATEHLFTYVNFSNLVVMGGLMLAATKDHPETDLRSHYRSMYHGFPIDIGVHGLTASDTLTKIMTICNQIQKFSPVEIRYDLDETYLILHLGDLYPRIRIRTVNYLDRAQVLIDQPIDAFCIGFNGVDLFMTPRGYQSQLHCRIHYNHLADPKIVWLLRNRGYSVDELERGINVYKKEFEDLNSADQNWVIINHGTSQKYDQIVQEGQLRPIKTLATSETTDGLSKDHIFPTIEIKKPTLWKLMVDKLLTPKEDPRSHNFLVVKEPQLHQTDLILLRGQTDNLIQTNCTTDPQHLINLSVAIGNLRLTKKIIDLTNLDLQIPTFIADLLVCSDSNEVLELLTKLTKLNLLSSELFSRLLHLQTEDPNQKNYLTAVKILLENTKDQKLFPISSVNYSLIRTIIMADPKFMNRYFYDKKSSYTPLSKIATIMSRENYLYKQREYLDRIATQPKSLIDWLVGNFFKTNEPKKTVSQNDTIIHLLKKHGHSVYLKSYDIMPSIQISIIPLTDPDKSLDERYLKLYNDIWQDTLTVDTLTNLEMCTMESLSRFNILHLAVYNDNDVLFRLLLEHINESSLEILLNHQSTSGTVLDLILSRGSYSSLDQIIDMRTDLLLSSVVVGGLTYTNSYSYLLNQGKISLASKLEDWRGHHSYLLEVVTGGYAQSVYYLSRYRSDPEPLDQVDSEGNNLLHRIVLYGKYNDHLDRYIKCIKLIVKLAPELLASTNHKDETPLNIVVKMSSWRLFPLFTELGCDPAKDLIHAVVIDGDLKMLETATVRYSQLINERDDEGRTPTMIAIMGDHKEMLDHLLNLGADLSIKDKYYNTVHHYAARHASYDLVSPKIEPSKNLFGMTPLEYLQQRLRWMVLTKDYKQIFRLRQRQKAFIKDRSS